MFEALKTRYSTWKRYNRTVAELSALTSRELADLGIVRADIEQIARSAARWSLNSAEPRKDQPMFETLKTRITNWRKFNRTVAELNALSNRELDDLGINRHDIKSVARQAAR
jgi:uncharacterized protein YjiS (DUF1127 family)